jgi:hypothetical protein
MPSVPTLFQSWFIPREQQNQKDPPHVAQISINSLKPEILFMYL